MPAKKKADYYQARHAFGVVYDDEQITITAGEIVPAGHKLLKQLGKDAVDEHFEPVTSFGRWDAPDTPDDEPVEQATAGPGEKRA